MLGTLTGIGGAMLLTFLKGVEINIWTFHINLLHKKGHTGTLNGDSGSKLLGIFCGLGSCFCFALWLIIQVISLSTFFLCNELKYLDTSHNFISVYVYVSFRLICGSNVIGHYMT